MSEASFNIYSEYLDFVLRSTNHGIWEYDIAAGKVLYDHDSEINLQGVKKNKEIRLEDIKERVHPDDSSRVINELEHFIDSSDELISVVFQYYSKSWRWIEINAKKIELRNGKPQKIIGIYSDITTKVETEQLNLLKSKELEDVYLKLKANEEIFRQLVENTNDIFMLRDEKNFIYINNQFEKIWGRDMFEILENPRKMLDWVHPDDKEKIDIWVDFNQFVSDKPIIEQYRIIKPDGIIRWIWTRTYPVFDDENRLYRIVSISTDISDQKEFEDALQLAKERALESDLLKSNFLANISHEIRTPMNGIIGFAELITREDLELNTRKNYVAIMKKSSEQLVRIIDDIIDFAKIEANQIRISPVSFNLNKLIDDVSVIFGNQLSASEKAHISLTDYKELPDNKAEIISDDFRIRQVLSNLLDNAVKFTNDGVIEFGYSLNDDKIEFFVKDTGIGISADKIDLIFERFRQADEGHTRKYGGNGLGLPISKGLVNILGGHIHVESIQGKGSSFYFTIPYQAENNSHKNENNTGKFTSKYKWKEKVFLIAEDDDMNFEYLRIILENTQAKIIRAIDGSQAIKLCSKLSFDLILMDIRLPVLNGIEATRHIRDMGIKTPIIAQTAFALNDDAKNCIEAGCNKYISKPISMEALYKMIETVLI